MQPDPKIDCANAAIVTLAGREWFVPLLAMRQARIVVPALMALLPSLEAIRRNQLAALSQENFDLMLRAVHGSLTRAYPDLRFDDFLDLMITSEELVVAVQTVFVQAGLFKKEAAAEQGEDETGEAQGETASPSTAPQPDSTDSSPITANAAANPGPTS
jgi:hypothetical protein